MTAQTFILVFGGGVLIVAALAIAGIVDAVQSATDRAQERKRK